MVSWYVKQQNVDLKNDKNFIVENAEIHFVNIGQYLKSYYKLHQVDSSKVLQLPTRLEKKSYSKTAR